MCDFTNDSDMDENLLPSEIRDVEVDVSSVLLPGKSKKWYEKTYEKFMTWRLDNNMSTFSENVLLSYFQDSSQKFKASTLWTEFSMLKSTLMINHQVNIAPYMKLNAFLKSLSKGYKSKQSKTFLPKEIEEFLEKAPDKLYLSTKVALIFGIVGACRRHELHDLKFNDVKDLDTAILVNITNSNPRKERMFTVKGKFYEMSKRYISLRPKPCETPNFFLRYSSGQCSAQNVGINSFGNMGKLIATYLNLADPDSYTGHCFRRTSETMSMAGGDIGLLHKYEKWKDANAPERPLSGTRPEAPTVSSRTESVPMECSIPNQKVQAPADWSKGELTNMETVNWENLETQLMISVKTEVTNPSEDPLSDSSEVVCDSDRTQYTDSDSVPIKSLFKIEIEPDSGTLNGGCDDSTAVSQDKTDEAIRPERTETQDSYLDTQTRLLEAILECVTRQQRTAAKAARAQASQARSLARIARLLERTGRR